MTISFRLIKVNMSACPSSPAAHVHPVQHGAAPPPYVHRSSFNHLCLLIRFSLPIVFPSPRPSEPSTPSIVNQRLSPTRRPSTIPGCLPRLDCLYSRSVVRSLPANRQLIGCIHPGEIPPGQGTGQKIIKKLIAERKEFVY